jgi:hypothetical protein
MSTRGKHSLGKILSEKKRTFRLDETQTRQLAENLKKAQRDIK